MATIPTFATFGAGEVVTDAKLNTNIKDAGNFFRVRPMCQLSATVTQSVAHNAYAIGVVNTIDVDTDGMADLANNKIIIQTPGVYRVSCGTFYASNATGTRYATVRDGAGAAGTGLFYAFEAVPGASTGGAGPSATRLVRFTAGTSLRLELYQNSGAALSTATPFYLTHFAAEWVAA
jgi:hypothetical protein